MITSVPPAPCLVYDELDHQIRIVGADPDTASDATPDKIAAETRFTYDAAGNVASTSVRRNVDPLGTTASSADVFLTTFSLYDRLDGPTVSIDENGAATQYRYDISGMKTQLTDASFNPTSPEASKSETAGKLFAVFLTLLFQDSSVLKSET